MRKEWIDQLQNEFGGALRRNVPMRDYTSFRIGGAADAVLFAQSEEQLVRAVRLCKEAGERYLVVGNGSNLLVSDRGVRDLVIMIRDAFSQVSFSDETMTVGAGVRLTAAAQTAAGQSLSGLEFAYGIPGLVGGALAMNAGAYGGEMAQIVQSVRILEPDGEIHEFSNEQMEFGYRKSALKNGRIALSATLLLHRGEEEAIRARMAQYKSARQEKQPLSFPNAGSVFKRPEGHFAGALIENAGLKGVSVGGAQVSQKHAGFIVNTGTATCQDVLELIKLIQKCVLEQSGVQLETELRPVGDFE